MHQGVKWMLVAAGGVVLLAGAVYGASAWRGATPPQREALAEMERPVELPGRNAFAAMMLLRYPLGEAELTALEQPGSWSGIAVDSTNGMLTLPKDFERHLVGDLAPFEPNLDGAPCSGDRPCLSAVEAAGDDASAWVEGHRAWLDRIDRLSTYGHYRSLLPATLSWPEALGDVRTALRSDRATQFVTGELSRSLSQVCGDIGAWRQLAAHSESLVVWLGAQRVAEGQMELFAEMLDRWAAGTVLPAACEVALAPPSQEEMSTCTAMRGEYAIGKEMRAHPENEVDGQLAGVLYRADMNNALAADALLRICKGGEATHDDQRTPRPPMWTRLECVRNATGCILIDLAEPAYATYVARAKAFGDHVRLTATLAWLHGTDTSDSRPLAERLADRPEALEGVWPVRVVDGGAALEVVEKADTLRTFRLPIPGRLRD